MSRADLEGAIEANPFDPCGELTALQLARKVVEAAAFVERHREVLGLPPHVGVRWANGRDHDPTAALHGIRVAFTLKEEKDDGV